MTAVRHRTVVLLLALATAGMWAAVARADPAVPADGAAGVTAPVPSGFSDGGDATAPTPSGFSDGGDASAPTPSGFSDGGDATAPTPCGFSDGGDSLVIAATT
jgi:hypothetical protein